MEVKIKVIPSNRNEWVGIFGDVIKIRLITEVGIENALSAFIEYDFGIDESHFKIINTDNMFIYLLTIPVEGYEILISNVSQKTA